MSTRFPLTLGLALVCAVGLTGLVTAQNNPPQQPPRQAGGGGRPLKVGVVDIGILFRDYKRKDTLEQAVNQVREQIKSDLEADAEEIRRKRIQLDKAFTPGTEPYSILRDEIKQATFVYELKTERLQNQLKKRVEELTLQILDELNATIRAYGERHGYDLILKSDREEGLEGLQSELTQQFQERIFRAQISDVLYFAQQVDVTDGVKAQLNSDSNVKRMEQLQRDREQKRQAAVNAPVQPANQGAQPPQAPGTPPSAPPPAQRGR
ncbi:MAG: OmpH family outer membrane protein [Planctomycetes bacterium]|nr:OmpH family outer membrane protein [Planctomycetota bacterium]